MVESAIPEKAFVSRLRRAKSVVLLFGPVASSAVLIGSALLAPSSARAAVTTVYADFNGATPGFGTPANTSETAANWTTDNTGSSMPAAFTAGGAYTTIFGTATYPMTGTFDLSLNQSTTTDFDGIALPSSGLNVTLRGSHGNTNSANYWNVAQGSTLTDDVTDGNNYSGTNPGFNFSTRQLILQGGGVITFETFMGSNGTGTFTENGNGLVVNLQVGAGATTSADEAFSGNFNLENGELDFQTASSATAFSGFSNASVFAITGGSIDNTSGSPQTLSLSGSLGSGAYTIGGSFTFIGTNSLSLGPAAVALSNNPTITANANTLTIPGNISGASALTVAGAGTISLSGANSYSGGTTISGGALAVGNASALGSTSGPLSIGGGSGAATLALGNYSVTVGAATLNGSANITGGASGNLTAASLSVLGTGNTISSGTVSANATIGLTGSNNSLAVNGTLAGTVDVYTGELSGTGSITGLVTAHGGSTISPGGDGAVGTLNLTGGLDLGSNNQLNVDIASGSSDLIATTTLKLINASTDTVAFNFLSVAPTLNTPYTLFTFNNLIGDPTQLLTSNLPSGVQATFSTVDGDAVDVTFTAVPEPATFGTLVALGSALLVRRSRRLLNEGASL